MPKRKRVQKSSSLSPGKRPDRPEAPRTRTHSKQEKVVALLSKPEGVTIKQITRVTGWQQHSVRGFFAAVVQKKLGFTLASQKTDGVRVYRITKGSLAKESPPTGKPQSESSAEQAV
jgi:hypothetical protein